MSRPPTCSKIVNARQSVGQQLQQRDDDLRSASIRLLMFSRLACDRPQQSWRIDNSPHWVRYPPKAVLAGCDPVPWGSSASLSNPLTYPTKTPPTFSKSIESENSFTALIQSHDREPRASSCYTLSASYPERSSLREMPWKSIQAKAKARSQPPKNATTISFGAIPSESVRGAVKPSNIPHLA